VLECAERVEYSVRFSDVLKDQQTDNVLGMYRNVVEPKSHVMASC